MTRKTIQVMIADDQTMFREGIKDLLENEKFIQIAGEASDGEEAVRLASKLKPDVILMDIKLPKMDGIELLQKIRIQHPDVPVVLMTAFATIGTAVQAMRDGAYDFIQKPFSPQQLVGVDGFCLRKECDTRAD